MPSVPNPLADEIDRRIEASPDHRTDAIRRIRREYSRRLESAPPGEVLDLADALVERRRWVAYELVHHHPGAFAALDVATVTRLGRASTAGAPSTRSAATSPDPRGGSGASPTLPCTSGRGRRIAGGGARRSSRPCP